MDYPFYVNNFDRVQDHRIKHPSVGRIFEQPMAFWYGERNGKDHYGVRMHNKGFTCECQGFNRHGRCKHIIGIENLICDDSEPVKYAI